MENEEQNRQMPKNVVLTEELLKQSAELRKRNTEVNEKLQELKDQSKELLRPDEDSKG